MPPTALDLDRDAGSWTALDLIEHFGPIPLHRVVTAPAPGTASEDDAVRLAEHGDRLCELVAGTLVEKPMGNFESYLAARLINLLLTFVEPRRLGMVLGADGLMRLAPGLVRIPDVSFIAIERLPDGRVPRTPVSEIAPDLAVEVISPGNTAHEMRQKLGDYFTAGVRLVWYVYPDPREVHVYRSPGQPTVVKHADTLDGDDVLTGFTLPLEDLFTEPGESKP